MAFDPDDTTSRRRREVGVFAREAWSALQATLQRFRDVKESRNRRALNETRAACEDALVALERLQDALRSLSREIHVHRASITRLASIPPRESSA